MELLTGLFLISGLPEVPRREGDQHVRVLQLCGWLRPHHPHQGLGSCPWPLPVWPSPTPLSPYAPGLGPHPCTSSGTGSHGDWFFCRSSWSRSESSGTLPSTMACHISWRPWSGCCRRTPSWAISKAGLSPLCPSFPAGDHLHDSAPKKMTFRVLSGRGHLAQTSHPARAGSGPPGSQSQPWSGQPDESFLCTNTCGLCCCCCRAWPSCPISASSLPSGPSV